MATKRQKASKQKEALLSHDYLKSILSYSKSTGNFKWKINKLHGACKGDIAGGLNTYGYVIVCIPGNHGGHFTAHRLAYFYVKGQWPEDLIDHKNGIRHDNRWKNLRDASYRFNMENRQGPNTGSSSGVLGVYGTDSGAFQAAIRVDKKLRYLGQYPTARLAHKAYLAAKRTLHAGNTL